METINGMRLYDLERYVKKHTFNEIFRIMKNDESTNKNVHVSAFSYKGSRCIIFACSGTGVIQIFFRGDTFIYLRSMSSYLNYFLNGDYLTYNAKSFIDNDFYKRMVYNIENGYERNAKRQYKEFKKQQGQQTVKITESRLRRFIKESIEKYLRGMRDINNIVTDKFSLPPVYRAALFEAAFILLGYERFAVDGEIAFNDFMDDPWNDAYDILDWAVKNKGLNPKYLGKVSKQHSGVSDEAFNAYFNAVNCGKEFWFTKEELAEIFSKLPQNLQKILVKDMLNAGRIQKINDTVAQMAAMNGGENMEKFFEALKPLLNGQKWNRQTFKEPVKQAMQISNMLPQINKQ